MIDDKTVLFSESNGKKIILTILFWKQWPWKPPWYVIVIEMKVSGGYRERVKSIRCLRQILSYLLWKQRPPNKPPWLQDDLEEEED